MSKAGYLLSRVIRKLRGSAVLHSSIDRTAKIESGSTVLNSNIGRHSFCGYDCTLVNVDIGAFCSIASHVSIGGARHPVEFVSTSPVFLSHRDSVTAKFARHDYLPQDRASIGSDVWIGERVLVRAGVRIGHGAVVGMGSVVTRDVEPYTIVAGNPARPLRARFEQRVIDGLLRLQWWTFDDARLRDIGPFIADPVALLQREGLW